MRYLPSDSRTRKQAEELTRLSGRMGGTRVPDEALALVGDISDTGLHALLDALEDGQRERSRP